MWDDDGDRLGLPTFAGSTPTTYTFCPFNCRYGLTHPPSSPPPSVHLCHPDTQSSTKRSPSRTDTPTLRFLPRSRPEVVAFDVYSFISDKLHRSFSDIADRRSYELIIPTEVLSRALNSDLTHPYVALCYHGRHPSLGQ